MASKKRFKKYSEINFNNPKRRDYLAFVHYFLINEIDIEVFTSKMMIYFYQNSIDPNYFSHAENKEVDKIFDVCDWFSPFESDHVAYSGYTTADQVRTTVENAAQILPVL